MPGISMSKRNQIRLDLWNPGQRLTAVRRRAGDDDPRLGCQQIAEQPSNERRIVDD